MSLVEFSRDSLKIPENGLRYQSILAKRVKAIKDKKIELLHLADAGEYELSKNKMEMYNKVRDL